MVWCAVFMAVIAGISIPQLRELRAIPGTRSLRQHLGKQQLQLIISSWVPTIIIRKAPGHFRLWWKYLGVQCCNLRLARRDLQGESWDWPSCIDACTSTIIHFNADVIASAATRWKPALGIGMGSFFKP